MKTFGIILATFVLILSGCGELEEPNGQVAKEAPTKNQKLREFEPTPDQKLLLGDRVEFHGHSICPPNGYTKVDTAAQSRALGAKVSAWVGQVREDGTTPLFQVLIGSYPESQPVPKLEDAIVTWMNGQRQDRTEWTETKVEYGTINGRRFARQTWEGKEPNLSIALRGVCFVAVEGRQLLALQTMDCGPDFTGLAIGEAALTTFQ